MDYFILVYFGIGALQAVLGAVNLKLIVKDQAISAGAISFVTNLIGLLVLYSIIARLNQERSTIAIVAFSLGVGFGIFLATKFKPLRMKSEK